MTTRKQTITDIARTCWLKMSSYPVYVTYSPNADWWKYRAIFPATLTNQQILDALDLVGISCQPSYNGPGQTFHRRGYLIRTKTRVMYHQSAGVDI